MFLRLTASLILAAAACAQEAVPFSDALAAGRVRAEISGNGRDNATLQLTNPGAAPLKITVPAGLVLGAADGQRQIVLRTLTTELSAGAGADAVLPTAALATTNTATQRALAPAAAEAKLAPLLALFDKQNDLPRPTAQLAIFILIEDIKFPAWQKWLAPAWANEKPPRQTFTPAEIAQAVDAAAFVRLASPALKPALLGDDNFKRLALRNPWARGKAMVLYSLSVEDAITGEPSLPPDLGKLLHTATGDNCPICRKRDEMQKDNGL